MTKMFRVDPFLLEVVFVDCGKNAEINPQKKLCARLYVTK